MMSNSHFKGSFDAEGEKVGRRRGGRERGGLIKSHFRKKILKTTPVRLSLTMRSLLTTSGQASTGKVVRVHKGSIPLLQMSKRGGVSMSVGPKNGALAKEKAKRPCVSNNLAGDL